MRSHGLQAVKEEARISLRDVGYKLFSYVSWWLASDCSLIEMVHTNHTRYLLLYFEISLWMSYYFAIVEYSGWFILYMRIPIMF